MDLYSAVGACDRALVLSKPVWLTAVAHMGDPLTARGELIVDRERSALPDLLGLCSLAVWSVTALQRIAGMCCSDLGRAVFWPVLKASVLGSDHYLSQDGRLPITRGFERQLAPVLVSNPIVLVGAIFVRAKTTST